MAARWLCRCGHCVSRAMFIGRGDIKLCHSAASHGAPCSCTCLARVRVPGQGSALLAPLSAMRVCQTTPRASTPPQHPLLLPWPAHGCYVTVTSPQGVELVHKYAGTVRVDITIDLGGEGSAVLKSRV
jgi:hypothetical protein